MPETTEIAEHGPGAAATSPDKLTPARVAYYEGIYEHHREANPLPPGWDGEFLVSPDHGCLELWFWSRLENVRGEKDVRVLLKTPGKIRIHFWSELADDEDARPYHWTAREMSELLRRLIGLELRPAEIGVMDYTHAEARFTVPDTVFNR